MGSRGGGDVLTSRKPYVSQLTRHHPGAAHHPEHHQGVVEEGRGGRPNTSSKVSKIAGMFQGGVVGAGRADEEASPSGPSTISSSSNAALGGAAQEGPQHATVVRTESHLARFNNARALFEKMGQSEGGQGRSAAPVTKVIPAAVFSKGDAARDAKGISKLEVRSDMGSKVDSKRWTGSSTSATRQSLVSHHLRHQSAGGGSSSGEDRLSARSDRGESVSPARSAGASSSSSRSTSPSPARANGHHTEQDISGGGGGGSIGTTLGVSGLGLRRPGSASTRSHSTSSTESEAGKRWPPGGKPSSISDTKTSSSSIAQPSRPESFKSDFSDFRKKPEKPAKPENLDQRRVSSHEQHQELIARHKNWFQAFSKNRSPASSPVKPDSRPGSPNKGEARPSSPTKPDETRPASPSKLDWKGSAQQSKSDLRSPRGISGAGEKEMKEREDKRQKNEVDEGITKDVVSVKADEQEAWSSVLQSRYGSKARDILSTRARTDGDTNIDWRKDRSAILTGHTGQRHSSSEEETPVPTKGQPKFEDASTLQSGWSPPQNYNQLETSAASQESGQSTAVKTLKEEINVAETERTKYERQAIKENGHRSITANGSTEEGLVKDDGVERENTVSLEKKEHADLIVSESVVIKDATKEKDIERKYEAVSRGDNNSGLYSSVNKYEKKSCHSKETSDEVNSRLKESASGHSSGEVLESRDFRREFEERIGRRQQQQQQYYESERRIGRKDDGIDAKRTEDSLESSKRIRDWSSGEPHRTHGSEGGAERDDVSAELRLRGRSEENREFRQRERSEGGWESKQRRDRSDESHESRRRDRSDEGFEVRRKDRSEEFSVEEGLELRHRESTSESFEVRHHRERRVESSDITRRQTREESPSDSVHRQKSEERHKEKTDRHAERRSSGLASLMHSRHVESSEEGYREDDQQTDRTEECDLLTRTQMSEVHGLVRRKEQGESRVQDDLERDESRVTKDIAQQEEQVSQIESQISSRLEAQTSDSTSESLPTESQASQIASEADTSETYSNASQCPFTSQVTVEFQAPPSSPSGTPLESQSSEESGAAIVEGVVVGGLLNALKAETVYVSSSEDLSQHEDLKREAKLQAEPAEDTIAEDTEQREEEEERKQRERIREEYEDPLEPSVRRQLFPDVVPECKLMSPVPEEGPEPPTLLSPCAQSLAALDALIHGSQEESPVLESDHPVSAPRTVGEMEHDEEEIMYDHTVISAQHKLQFCTTPVTVEGIAPDTSSNGTDPEPLPPPIPPHGVTTSSSSRSTTSEETPSLIHPDVMTPDEAQRLLSIKDGQSLLSDEEAQEVVLLLSPQEQDGPKDFPPVPPHHTDVAPAVPPHYAELPPVVPPHYAESTPPVPPHYAPVEDEYDTRVASHFDPTLTSPLSPEDEPSEADSSEASGDISQISRVKEVLVEDGVHYLEDGHFWVEVPGIPEEDEDEDNDPNLPFHPHTRLTFSKDPIQVFSTFSVTEYDRKNDEVDPVAASAEYELEKRVEKMDVFPVDIVKGEGGLGLSIIGMGVGADAGVEKLGIFVKTITPGGATERDARIQVNDQIIEVDGKSLVGVTQVFAASVLKNTSGLVHFLIGREKDPENSEVALLIKQSLQADREREERRRALGGPDYDPHTGHGIFDPLSSPSDENSRSDEVSVHHNYSSYFEGGSSPTSPDAVSPPPEVFDLEGDTSDTSPENDVSSLKLKLKEIQYRNAVAEAEITKLKMKLMEMEKFVEENSQYTGQLHEAQNKIVELDDKLHSKQSEVSTYQDMLEQSQGQFIVLEKKYYKAKKIIKEYQGRERDFLHREEYHITQLEDKDSHYNALVKALKDRVIHLEGELTTAQKQAGLPVQVPAEPSAQPAYWHLQQSTQSALAKQPPRKPSLCTLDPEISDTETSDPGTAEGEKANTVERKLPVKEELDEAVPPHELLDVSASRAKGELAARGGLANRHLPSLKKTTSMSSAGSQDQSLDDSSLDDDLPEALKHSAVEATLEGQQEQVSRRSAEPQESLVQPQISPLPHQTASLPPQSASVPTQSAPIPSQTAPLPPQSTSLPPQGTSLPPQSTSLPHQSASLPTQSTSLPPQSTSLPPHSTTLPHQSTSMPIQSIPHTTSINQSKSPQHPPPYNQATMGSIGHLGSPPPYQHPSGGHFVTSRQQPLTSTHPPPDPSTGLPASRPLGAFTDTQIHHESRLESRPEIPYRHPPPVARVQPVNRAEISESASLAAHLANRTPQQQSLAEQLKALLAESFREGQNEVQPRNDREASPNKRSPTSLMEDVRQAVLQADVSPHVVPSGQMVHQVSSTQRSQSTFYSPGGRDSVRETNAGSQSPRLGRSSTHASPASSVNANPTGVVLLSQRPLDSSLVSHKLGPGVDGSSGDLSSGPASLGSGDEGSGASLGSQSSLSVTQPTPERSKRSHMWQTAPVVDWSKEQVSQWLVVQGLENCVSKFQDIGMTGPRLLNLDVRDLKNLGLPQEEKSKLKRKVKELRLVVERERKQVEKEKKEREKLQKKAEKLAEKAEKKKK